MGELGLQVGQGELQASPRFSLNFHLQAVLLRVDEWHREVISHVVQLVGCDEPRVKEEFRRRLSVEGTGAVDDENG